MRFFIAFCLITQLAFAGVQSDIQAIIDHSNPNLNIGIVVEDLSSGKTILSLNPDRHFIPASNLKLYTAISALAYLHPHYQIRTAFLSLKKIHTGVLPGNLYLKMQGAPDFDTEQLNHLVKQLKRQGLRQIQGRIVIDDSAMDKVTQGPGWMWDDAPHCFAAPVSAIVLNHNCLDLPLTGNKKIRLAEKPNAVSVKLRGLRVKPKQKHCKVSIKANQQNQYQISGCMKHPKKLLSIAIHNPKAYLIAQLKQALKANQIQFPSRIQSGVTPKKAKVIAQVKSAPLHELVAHMLKESDNLYADTLFKHVGYRYYDKPASWALSADARKAILNEQYQLDFAHINMVDGSGLSQYNLTTPKLTVDLLKKAHQDFRLFAETLTALPISGIDGTLKHRLKQEGIQYKVRAKTGSLSHISSLSGYIETQQKHLLAFSIYINGAFGSADKYRTLEDEIVIQLSQLS